MRPRTRPIGPLMVRSTGPSASLRRHARVAGIGGAAMRPNRGGGVGSAAGAVGAHLARHLRQRARTGPPVFDVAGRHGRGFDQGRGVTGRRDLRRASAAAAGGCGERPREATRSPRFAREAWQAVEELGQGRATTDASPPPSRPMSPRGDPSARSSAHPEPQACSLSSVPFQSNVMATDPPSPAKGLMACPKSMPPHRTGCAA